MTCVSLDAPLVEIGDITTTLLGSQKNPNVWRRHIGPTQRFYSWVMNNHWGTNCAYQEGAVKFRYALRPHAGYDPVAASRLAIRLSQPLLASAAAADSPNDSLLLIEPDDVLALTLKPTQDGKGWIVRLFGASGEDRKARLFWAKSLARNSSPRMCLSDLSEQALTPVDGEVAVAGLDLVTLRIESI